MTDPVRQIESERKYEVDGGAAAPTFASSRARVTEKLDATYLDTADRQLAARRAVVRRRRGGHDAGWHVKLPAGTDRVENRWPDSEVPPAELLSLVGLDVEELHPIARLRTTRFPIELLDADGGVLAEFVDDHVRSTDLATGVKRRWREWEVELGPAAPDDPSEREGLLDSIETALVAAGARRSSLPSKLVHAVAPSAPQIVVEAVADLVAQLDGAEAAAVADADDAVHQARVLVRRLRSVLATYRRHFSGKQVRHLRDDLRDLGLDLGHPRDLEVRARRIEEFNGSADDEWKAYRRAYQVLVHHLRSNLHRQLRVELETFSTQPPIKVVKDASAAETLLLDLATSCERVHRLASHAARASDEDREVALHEVRKKARRVRYSAQIHLTHPGPRGESVFDEATLALLGELASAAEAVQNVLGEHRDDLALADHLDSIEQYGLAAQARARAEAHLQAYPAALEAFAAASAAFDPT